MQHDSGYAKSDLSNWTLTRRLLAMAWRYRRGCLLVITLQLCMLGLALSGLGLTGVAIDYMRHTAQPAAPPPHWPLGLVPPAHWTTVQVLGANAGAILALALLHAFLMYAYSLEIARLLQGKVVVHLRSAVYAKMQSLSFRFFDANASGSLINRVTGDVQSTRLFIDGVVMQSLTLTLSLAFYLVYMLRIHVPLTLACLSTTPLLWLLSTLFARKIRPSYQRNRELADDMILSFSETIQGIQVLKGFAREPETAARFDAASRAVRDHRYRIIESVSRFTPSISFMTQLNILIALGYGGYLVIRGQIPLGSGLVVFAGLLQQFSGQVANIAAIANSLQESLTAARRVFEVLDAPVEIQSRPDAAPLASMRGALSFRHVSFAYEAAPVLRDVSFDIQAGTCVAITGPTASGKSTLLSLIPRFYDPTQGSLCLDGHDLRTLDLRDLRRRIGVVFQESFLFSNSIAANIAFGDPGATRGQVEQAARVAAAHDFIMAMPDGYDSVLTEGGANLSGGQRQRLAIARALLLDPSILILDDPTAAVDSQTEHEILAAMEAAMRGRTTFLVTHRISALRRADRILVLERGRIVQAGTHAALMAARGPYQRLVMLQGGDDEGDGPALPATAPQGGPLP